MKNKSIFATSKSYSSGFNTKKNYSSFWMDDDKDIYSKYSGLGEKVSASSDLFKVIKLNNYRRAITNFVKIVTGMDIPVTWYSGGSYTDSKTINLTSDIKDNNFDVTVGLALHEASHIKLTDFQILQDMFAGKIEIVTRCKGRTSMIKEMLNWIEDRRIDHYIFSTSPGYKAYYHKLYDYYWNDKAVNAGFKSVQYCDPTQIESYQFHIINMLNPLFDAKALPGLEEIAKLIDVKNISRLKSTYEALEVAVAVVDVIMSNVQDAQAQQAAPQQDSDSQEAQEQQGEGEGDGGSGSGESSNASEGEGSSDTQDLNELSDKEVAAIEKALDNMRNFLEGQTNKKSATKGLQRQLQATANQDINVQAVGGEQGVKSQSCLTMDGVTSSLSELYTKQDMQSQLREQVNDLKAQSRYSEAQKFNQALLDLNEELNAHPLRYYFNNTNNPHNTTTKAVQTGLEMGALLGKKLQLHNESREKVDTRLRSGKIDNSRLAHAGYGIDSIFRQITVDKYKKANLHISLDGSGSMKGNNWDSAAQMTTAIVKACTYTQNINVQVSIRATLNGDVPVTISIYDSRKNNLNHVTRALSSYSCNSNTPEGLCFEAMYKQNQLVTGSSDLDSYFLNISDGMPGMGGYDYYGQSAVNHTAKWVNKMINDHNIKLMSFYLSDNSDMERALSSFNSSHTGRMFREMYGKNASVVNPSSVMDIARELNKKFMSR